MSTNKETIKVITKGVERHCHCPMIDMVADRAAQVFEQSIEWDYDDRLYHLVKDLIADEYVRGSCRTAMKIVVLVLNNAEMYSEADMVMLIVDNGSEDASRQFMDLFVRLVEAPVSDYLS